MCNIRTIVTPQEGIGCAIGGTKGDITDGITKMKKCYPNGDGITSDEDEEITPDGDGITARPNNDGVSPGDIKPYVDRPGI